ncbi:OmpA family protein [Carboxylicivirga taeanensis]|uniref:OmpA family protein n=1 Tax=Carboxylicivirga taeanensis TaxID=1416875 RepID=UPI003F6DEC30
MIKKIYILSITAILVGCVPLKQFEEVTAENEQLEQTAELATKENNALKVQTDELAAKLEHYQNKVELLVQDTARLARQYKRLQYRYDDLNKNYADVLNGLKTRSNSDVNNQKLLTYLQQLQENLQKREDELVLAEQALAQKQRSLEQAQRELTEAEAQLRQQNQRLIELEELLTRKDEAMRTLKQTINDALTGFSGDELQVHMKNGKVYVSLEEKLLFESGKYTVNQHGVSALQKIAGVLEQNNDVDILVEGHTDNVPYNGRGDLKDNWDLSVKRATSVVRILLENSSISPRRITAAGRSKYIPVLEGSTPAALQKNRRTEVILTPRWVEVLELLELDK